MTSATDELRRLLDERGVEWSTTKGCDSDSITTVHVDGRFGGTEWEAFELADGTFQVTAGIYDELTPEQFIAATLGSGTCEFVDDSDGELPPKCSACGYEPSIYECSWLSDDGYRYDGNFCPNCGRKVMSHEE